MRTTIYDTWESLPDEPDENGVYVVIDTFKFTTTAIELLEQGADSVRVFQETDELVAFHDATDAPIGGEHRQLKNDAMQLCNSPSYVYEHHDVYEGAVVGLRSDNGATAVHALPVDAEIYLGSTVNATAVAQALSEDEGERVYLVCAGQHGEPAYEDLAAAHLIERQLMGCSPLTLTRRLLKRVCETTKWTRENHDKSRYHRADIRRVMNFNQSTVVPVRSDDYRFTQLGEGS